MLFVVSLLLLLSGVCASSDDLVFSLWSSNSDPGYQGVAMVSVAGAARGNLCRYFGCPDNTSASVICQRLDFHGLEEVATTTTEHDAEYGFRADHPSAMYELYCNNTACDYSSNPTCFDTTQYTYLSCSCNDSFYATAAGCVLCPAGSEDARGHKDRCNCPEGAYWSGSQCTACAQDTFSAANATQCTACPSTSRADAGSARCACPTGSYLAQDLCQECPAGSDGFWDRCACPAGLYWADGFCVPCPKYTSSEYNSVACASCPTGSRSVAGAAQCSCYAGLYMAGGTCKNCPEMHYSSFGSTTCTRCPEEAAETPDQTACSCPEGKVWSNGSCTVEPDRADEIKDIKDSSATNRSLLVMVMCVMSAIIVVLGLGWMKYGRATKAPDSKAVFSIVQENPNIPESIYSNEEGNPGPATK